MVISSDNGMRLAASFVDGLGSAYLSTSLKEPLLGVPELPVFGVFVFKNNKTCHGGVTICLPILVDTVS